MRSLRAGVPALLAAVWLGGCGGSSQPPTPTPTPTPPVAWLVPQRLGDGGPGSATARGGHLGLAADIDGSATAVWDSLAADESGRPWAARKAAGGAWSAAESVSERGRRPAVSGGLDPIVVWQVSDPDGGGIWWRARVNGTWDEPLFLGGDATAALPQVAGANYFGYAAWVSGSPPKAYAIEIDARAPSRVGDAQVERQVRFNGGLILIDSDRGLTWSRYRTFSKWEPQGVLSSRYQSGAYFDITPRGTAGNWPPTTWALWDEGGTIVASRFTGPLVPLFSISPGFASAALTSSSAGSIACLATVDARLQCSWALGTTDFAPPDPLPLQAAGATWIDVALDPQGGAALAWASPTGLFAVRASGPGRWGQSQRIDRGEGGRPIEVRLRADGSGRLLAVWTASLDGRATSVWASELAQP